MRLVKKEWERDVCSEDKKVPVSNKLGENNEENPRERKEKKKKETSCDKLWPDREMEVDLDTFSFVDSPGRGRERRIYKKKKKETWEESGRRNRNTIQRGQASKELATRIG